MLCPGTDVSSSTLAMTLSSRQIHKFASKYAHSQIYWSSCELFPLATTHAKVANSDRSKMLIALYRNHYFFQKGAPLPLTLLENQLATVARYFSSSLLPSSPYLPVTFPKTYSLIPLRITPSAWDSFRVHATVPKLDWWQISARTNVRVNRCQCV